MKKKFILFFLIINLLLFSSSFQIYFIIHRFGYTNIKKNIETLCSETYKGRLCGTIENQMAADYVKDQFIAAGLKPLNGSYFENFKVKYPENNASNPMLCIKSTEGAVVNSFTYGKDYKEDMINFRHNNLTFTKEHIIASNDTALFLKNDNGNVLFYTPEKDSIDFRSSFISDAKQDLYIMVTGSCMKAIMEGLNQGNELALNIPMDIKDTTVSNVTGIIKGKDSSKAPLVLSAHFDHVGTDCNNTIYRGSLDNASGTAFLIELARYISKLGVPTRDIIFVAFNGEEFGLLGSKAFVSNHKDLLKDSEVYNFDMIGSDNGVPLCIMASKNDSVNIPQVNKTAKILQKNKSYFNYLFEDASDHAPFRAENIAAITLCDNDTSKIHTPDDTPDKISYTAVERCFLTMKEIIWSQGYSADIRLNAYWNKILIGVSMILTVIFTGLYFRNKQKEC